MNLRNHLPSRLILATAVAAVMAGTAFAVGAGTSSAQATTAKATTAVRPTSAGGWSPGAGGWSPGAGWAGPAQGSWTPPPSARAEYFHVASTAPAGPGTIIITGVVDAGGVEHPGRAVDGATFAGGSFRIDHSAGQPSVRFNADTCVGTISQAGPFSVLDGTGRFSGLAGSGTYVFHALYTTARDAHGCTRVMTGYIESIYGMVTLSPSAARAVQAAAR